MPRALPPIEPLPMRVKLRGSGPTWRPKSVTSPRWRCSMNSVKTSMRYFRSSSAEAKSEAFLGATSRARPNSLRAISQLEKWLRSAW